MLLILFMIQNFINNLENEGNIVFVTHYVVIAAIFGQAVTSGEILIADQNLNVVAVSYTHLTLPTIYSV